MRRNEKPPDVLERLRLGMRGLLMVESRCDPALPGLIPLPDLTMAVACDGHWLGQEDRGCRNASSRPFIEPVCHGVHGEPSTPDPEPQTLNPEIETSNPQPQTQDTKPQTPNPQPQTFNPKIETLNQKPQTPHPKP